MTRSDKKQSKVFIVSRVTLYENYNDILVIGAFSIKIKQIRKILT